MTKLDPVRLELEAGDLQAIDTALEADSGAYAADVQAGQLPPAVADLLRRVRRAPAISSEEDQGWANHETMLCAAQLAGNMTPGGEAYRARVLALVREARGQAPRGEELGYVLERLRGWLEEQARQGGAWRQELATAALGRVDWHELAGEQLEALAELERGA
jgi:hypothetical protein